MKSIVSIPSSHLGIYWFTLLSKCTAEYEQGLSHYDEWKRNVFYTEHNSVHLVLTNVHLFGDLCVI